MKRITIAALCGLCLFGAFVCASAQGATNGDVTQLAFSRRACGTSS